MIMKSTRLTTLLTALFMSAVVVYADGVNFTTITTWNEALALAKESNKPIFLDAYTDWCGWCKVMDRNTYTNAQIIETLNANFVAVKFNPEKATTFKFGGKTMNNDELLLWLGRGKSYGYPTSYFWTNPGKGESVLVSVGYEDPAKFAETLQTVLKRKGS